MEVNNFKLIETLLFDKLDKEITTKTDYVILGRIIRRRKENPEDPRGEYIVKRYSFATKDRFLESIDEIKELCHVFNARFYIEVNIKSMKEITFEIAETIPGLIRKEQYYFIRRIFDNTADANKGVKEHRLWIFDIDDKAHLGPVLRYLSDNKLSVFIAGVFPTINGAHVLLNPHDIRYMDMAEINVGEETLTLKQIADVKKNAMTLIYYKNKEE